MRAAVIVAAVALGSCSSAGKRAEREYEIVARSGTATDQCQAAEKAAAAYLSDRDEPGYERWRQTASLDCAAARLARASASGDLSAEERDIENSLLQNER